MEWGDHFIYIMRTASLLRGQVGLRAFFLAGATKNGVCEFCLWKRKQYARL